MGTACVRSRGQEKGLQKVPLEEAWEAVHRGTVLGRPWSVMIMTLIFTQEHWGAVAGFWAGRWHNWLYPVKIPLAVHWRKGCDGARGLRGLNEEANEVWDPDERWWDLSIINSGNSEGRVDWRTYQEIWSRIVLHDGHCTSPWQEGVNCPWGA